MSSPTRPRRIAALALLACAAGAATASGMPPMDRSEAAEIGFAAQAASSCAMDAPELVAPVAGSQLAAAAMAASSPLEIARAGTDFAQARAAFAAEFAAANPAERSRLCAVGWLGWRSMREAPLASGPREQFAKSIEAARAVGSAHGAIWSCVSSSRTAPRDMAAQAGLAIAKSAARAGGLDEIEAASRAWSEGFAEARAPEQPPGGDSPTDCDGAVAALEIVGKGLGGSALGPTLARARAQRLRLRGRLL